MVDTPRREKTRNCERGGSKNNIVNIVMNDDSITSRWKKQDKRRNPGITEIDVSCPINKNDQWNNKELPEDPKVARGFRIYKARVGNQRGEVDGILMNSPIIRRREYKKILH